VVPCPSHCQNIPQAAAKVQRRQPCPWPAATAATTLFAGHQQHCSNLSVSSWRQPVISIFVQHRRCRQNMQQSQHCDDTGWVPVTTHPPEHTRAALVAAAFNWQSTPHWRTMAAFTQRSSSSSTEWAQSSPPALACPSAKLLVAMAHQPAASKAAPWGHPSPAELSHDGCSSLHKYYPSLLTNKGHDITQSNVLF
jgi:hypothetical protein